MTDPTDRWSVSLEETTLLGRYTVDRKIGGGGMANVYLATDDQLDMPVVVKVPHTAYLAEAGFRERFERETRDLISLQHPHIVRILARGEHEGLPFLILQFLQGGSLGDRIRKAKGEPMPYEAVRPWVRDVSRALDFIHQQGVVHRDIKPDNVLFDEHGHAYLSDFGIAKAVGGADTGLTVTGATPGSPAYMAPEQPRQSSLTGASDQYSLAATIYEALSGRPTHEGETVVDVLLKKQTEIPPPLASLQPDVPVAVSDAIVRALLRAPEERWPTCEAMVNAFRQPPSEVPTQTPPAPPQPTVPVQAPAVAQPAATSATHSVGTTVTLSGTSRKTVWMVLTALCLGVPLAMVFTGAFDPGEDAGYGATDMAAAPPPEDAGAHTDVPAPNEGSMHAPAVPAPRGATVADSRTMRGLQGTWVLDKSALERRIKAMRPDRKRPPRNSPQRKELERALKGGPELLLGADGRFRVIFHTRDARRAEPISGTWQVVDEFVLFKPDPAHASLDAKKAVEFQGRIRDGRLYLVRKGFELPLKKQ